MMATRTFCSAGVLALATIMGLCCARLCRLTLLRLDLRQIHQLEEVKPPKGAVAPGQSMLLSGTVQT
jgi:hypothetical protein